MKKLRILIADEESPSRTLLQTSLSYWGCEVLTVQNAEQAAAALWAGNIDVCILNWEFPAFDTPEMCRWISQAELRTKPHVIVLTETGSQETIRAAYVAGANDYLTRPLRIENLRSRISAIASRISRVNSLHWELGRFDPLECYRMDLALHARAQTRI